MYVDPNRNKEAGNLKWILPYCKPDLPRVAGAIVLFCVNNTMALIIPLLSGLIVDRVIIAPLLCRKNICRNPIAERFLNAYRHACTPCLVFRLSL